MGIFIFKLFLYIKHCYLAYIDFVACPCNGVIKRLWCNYKHFHKLYIQVIYLTVKYFRSVKNWPLIKNLLSMRTLASKEHIKGFLKESLCLVHVEKQVIFHAPCKDPDWQLCIIIKAFTVYTRHVQIPTIWDNRTRLFKRL